MKGRFISLEGIDGTGKSTQFALLAKRLREEGYDVLETKEPGSQYNQLGLELRTILFQTVKTTNMAPGVADALFLADHIQHVEKVIKPALAEGKLVITDRYADSEFAYAASAKATPDYMLEAYRAGFGPIPDLTLLFVSSDAETTLKRAQARRGIEAGKQDAKIWNAVTDQLSIQQCYLDLLAGKTRTAVIVVRPESTIGQIFEMVWEAVKASLMKPVDYIEGENRKVVELYNPPA